MGRRVVAIVIALAVALFGTIGVVAYAQGADSRAVAGQQTQNVYVAAVQVPRGTSAADAVAQKLIVRQRIVARGVPAGALTDVGALTGPLLARSDIMPGEIILASRFGVLSDLTKAQVIPAGKMAITVSLTDSERIAPLLTPQSHIVIFDTSGGAAAGKSGGTGTSPRLTRILLANVEVIGVGDLIVQSTPTPTPAPANAQAPQQAASSAALVTVAVSPADGQLLVHEIQAGNLLYGALLGGTVKVNPKYVVTDSSILGH